MENRTEVEQKIIETIAARVRRSLLALNERDAELQEATAAACAAGTIETYDNYNNAFDQWKIALRCHQATCGVALDVLGVLGDGFDEYNHALRDGTDMPGEE